MTALSINEPRTEMTLPDKPVSINEPPPKPSLVVDALMPAGCVAGDAPLTLVVAGSGFSPASVVWFGAQALTTTYFDDIELHAELDPSTWTIPGDVPVTVKDGDRTSNAVTFGVDAPAARKGRSIGHD